MKKIIALILTVCCLAAVQTGMADRVEDRNAEWAEKAEIVNQYAVVKTPNGKPLNVHVEPGVYTRNVMRVDDGTRVLVIRKRGNWCEIECDNQTGYVMTEYIQLNGEAGEALPSGEEDPADYTGDWNGHWAGTMNGQKTDMYINDCPLTGSYDVLLKIEDTYSYAFTPLSGDSVQMTFSVNGRTGLMTLNEEQHTITLTNLRSLDLPLIGREADEGELAYAGSSAVPGKADIHYQKNMDMPEMIYTCSFSAGMFMQDTTEFHADIARLTVVLAAAAYNPQESDAGNQIVEAYHALGIPDEHIMLFNYKGHPLNTPGFEEYDHEEFSIASRSMGDYTLLIICLRGSGAPGSEDWITDGAAISRESMNVWVHQGFFGYMNKAVVGINLYLQAHPKISNAMEAGKLKVLITGHSLGAGGANLLGAYLTSGANGDPWVGTDDMYVYTYACPRVMHEKDRLKPTTTSCSYIFNIVNGMDPVPQLPEDFRFAWKRFGTTYTYKTSYKDDPVFDTLEHFVHHEPLNYIQMIYDVFKEEKKQVDYLHGVIVSSDP